MRHNWEKVLWKRQAYRDNYVPPKLFLASLQRNRESCLDIQSQYELNQDLANFRPYTYWPLVILSCSITQHLATIFIFLSVFVRLKEGILDPRSLVWLTVILFSIGYGTWNALSNGPLINRACYSLAKLILPADPFGRSQSYEIVDHDVPRTHVLITSFADLDCSHLIRLHMGTGCLFVRAECSSC